MTPPPPDDPAPAGAPAEPAGRRGRPISRLNGENLLGGRFLRSSTKTPIITSPLMALIARLLVRGAREGVIRSGVDPLHLYVVMVSLSYFHRSNAHTLSTLFRTDLLAPSWQSQHKKVALDLLVRYLCEPPAGSSRH